MPRSVSGNYTLPLPPVVPNTTIEAAWANTTDDDIAQALTDSLDRYGRGGMVAPFRLVDGSESIPAWAFSAETGTGMWRETAAVMSVSVQGSKVGQWSADGYTGPLFGPITGDFSFDGTVTFDGPAVFDNPVLFTANAHVDMQGEFPLTFTHPGATVIWNDGTIRGYIQHVAVGDFMQLAALGPGGLSLANLTKAVTFTTDRFGPPVNRDVNLGSSLLRWNDAFISGLNASTPSIQMGVFESTNVAGGYLRFIAQSTARGFVGNGSNTMSGLALSDFGIVSGLDLVLGTDTNIERVRIATGGTATFKHGGATGSPPVVYPWNFMGVGSRTSISVGSSRDTGTDSIVGLVFNSWDGAAVNVGATLEHAYSLQAGGIANGLTIGTVRAGPMVFLTTNVERMRINATGAVGIGVNPAFQFDVLAASQSVARFKSSDTNGAFIRFSDGNAERGYIGSGSNVMGTMTNIDFGITSATGALVFGSGSTERARFLLGGTMVVGGTTAFRAISTSINILSSNTAIAIRHPSAAGSNYWDLNMLSNSEFYINNGSGVGVYLTYGGTAWLAASDERMKTDLLPIEGALAKVATLRAVTGRFKTDEVGVSRAFLIAQDVQAVLPEAVAPARDDMLGLAYSDVIPLLVAAIKELNARVH